MIQPIKVRKIAICLLFFLRILNLATVLTRRKSWKEIKSCRILILFYLLFPYFFYQNCYPFCASIEDWYDFTVGASTVRQSSEHWRLNPLPSSIFCHLLGKNTLSETHDCKHWGHIFSHIICDFTHYAGIAICMNRSRHLYVELWLPDF